MIFKVSTYNVTLTLDFLTSRLDLSISLSDLTTPEEEEEPKVDDTCRLRTGALNDLLISAALPPGQRKALITLRIPDPMARLEPKPYNTELVAFQHNSRHKQPCCLGMPFPMGQLASWTAGTQGACEGFTISSHGQATTISPRCGLMLCVILFEKNKGDLSNAMNLRDMSLYTPNRSKWRFEGVVLRQTDIL